MFVWGALLIPVVISLLGLVFFRKQVVWWETLLIIVPTFFIIFGVQGCYRMSVQQEPEYWGRYVTAVQYYEPWHEYHHETCTETYQCGSDKKGNAIYCTRTYDCSHHISHGPEWVAIDNYGENYSISKNEHDRLKDQFQTQPLFVDLFREKSYDLKHCRLDFDGDMYQTKFDGDINKMQPMTTKNTYTNKIIHSRTVFNYPEVSDTLKYLFPKLPAMPNGGGLFREQYQYGYQWSAPAIRGYQVPNFDNANHMLMKLNGQLGKEKEVRMQIILYHNAPQSYGDELEWYWKGGNMNEFNLVMSVSDSMTVQWARVISWTEVQELKLNVRNYVYTQKPFNLMSTVLYMSMEIKDKWVRKNFDTDFAYLNIDIPNGITILIYVLVFFMSGGLGFFAISNDVNNSEFRWNWGETLPARIKRAFAENKK
jgi:hypothetical protein